MWFKLFKPTFECNNVDSRGKVENKFANLIKNVPLLPRFLAI